MHVVIAMSSAGTAVEHSALRGVPLFRLAGIQVRLDPTWFFIFVLIAWSLAAGYFPQEYPNQSPAFYWLAGGITAVLFFASILLHELAHSLVARWRGLEVPSITLFLFGGVSEMRSEPPRATWELQIAIVGPLTSFVLAVVFWAISLALPAETPDLVLLSCRYLAWINAALGVFNLLPGFPLDGGRVLRALVWWRTGSLERATRTAATAGRWIGGGIAVLGVAEIFLGGLIGGLWLVLIGMFLRSMAVRGYHQMVLRQTLEHATVNEVMTRDPVTVPAAMSVRELVDRYFLGHGYRGFPVVDDRRVVGLVTIDDVRRLPRERWDEATVESCMHPVGDRYVVTPATPLPDAMRKLDEAGVGRLLVLRDGELAGMVSKEGLVRFLEIREVAASRG